MIETHAMLNYRIAVKMAQRLSALDITWYEEPAGPESADTLQAMRKMSLIDTIINGINITNLEKSMTEIDWKVLSTLLQTSN